MVTPENKCVSRRYAAARCSSFLDAFERNWTFTVTGWSFDWVSTNSTLTHQSATVSFGMTLSTWRPVTPGFAIALTPTKRPLGPFELGDGTFVPHPPGAFGTVVEDADTDGDEVQPAKTVDPSSAKASRRFARFDLATRKVYVPSDRAQANLPRTSQIFQR